MLASLGLQVAGVIPPLGLVVEVRAMIERELRLARLEGAGKAGGIIIARKRDRRSIGLVRALGGEPEANQDEREDEED